MAKFISNNSKDLLDSLPLKEVMAKNGYRPSRIGGVGAYYICPFHNENTPSFHIHHKKNVGEREEWHCFGCGRSGAGAITLEAALQGKDHKEDFIYICKELAKKFNVSIEWGNDKNSETEEEYMNGFFHRAKKVDAQGTFSLKEMDMNWTACEALGAKRTEIVRETDGEVRGVNCNWGEGFEPWMLEEDFAVKNVERMVLPCGAALNDKGAALNDKEKMINEKDEKKGQGARGEEQEKGQGARGKEQEKGDGDGAKSWEVRSAGFYPILAFKYEDADKRGYWKIYEPLLRKTGDKKEKERSKFYYYSMDGGDYELRGDLWGDVEFMEAWRLGRLERGARSEEQGAKNKGREKRKGMTEHPWVRVSLSEGQGAMLNDKGEMRNDKEQDEDDEKVWKFERLIICSGPKDGINAWYHGTAHVCWPMNEQVMITSEMMARLRKIAKDIYICYDIDRTGIAGMNRIALQYLDVKVVYLPPELTSIRSPRTKRPCKDLSEYLSYYPLPDGVTKRHAFMGLISNAIPMQFWKVIGGRRNVGGGREYEAKYEMLVDGVAQYAQARGFFFYQPKLYGEDGQLGHFYFHVEDNISSMIEDKEIVSSLKQDMLAFLSQNWYYNNQSLKNAIITSRRLIPDTMFALARRDTSFIAWGKDYCYFFFKNCAVRVTADAITSESYERLPFFVNKKAIINADFDYRGTEFFDIEYNTKTLKQLADTKARHLKALRDKGLYSEQTAHIENERMAKLERLWRYKLVFHGKTMNEMPPAFQVVYDAGRIYWKKEKAGLELTEDERQRQDMYFISKCLSIGYMLHPFRDPTRIYAVVSTDYNDQPGKAQGRNMKSFIGAQLLPLVRRGLMIGGKNINTKPDKFAENFSNYELTEHSYLYLDDLKTSLDVETLFNSGNMISKRKLYHDAVQIQGQWVPKIMMSTNNSKVFDLSSPSQYERIWLQPHSDYYHAEDERGQYGAYNPRLKFGRNIIDEMTDDERQETMWWLLKCCQLYIRENQEHFEHVIVRIDPDSKKQQERLADLIHDNDMILFFQDFFADERHYRRPISRKEMVLRFELFKLQKNEGVTIDHEVGVKREALNAQNVARFGKCLKSYCENLPYEKRIIVNPESLFKEEQRWRTEGVVSRQAWVSVLNDRFSENLVGYDPSRPREKKNDERCYYFYKIEDVPQSKEEVWGCGETDNIGARSKGQGAKLNDKGEMINDKEGQGAKLNDKGEMRNDKEGQGAKLNDKGEMRNDKEGEGAGG